MEDDKTKGTDAESGNIDEILRERERLDQRIHKEFKKEVTILFTDICGYTKFIDKRGDIAGRAMLQRHNDIVMPRVEKNNGVVIKTIGDAVMASFTTPLDAVRAAIEIQEGLQVHNSKADSADHILVKIGINLGKAIADGKDIYGDAVNVASRIQSEAGPDEILLSSTVYGEVGSSADLLCRWHGSVEVKGKEEALELYRVVWRDDDIVTDATAKVRGVAAIAERKVHAPIKVLRLEVAREGDRLKISAHEHLAGEESTIRHYEVTEASMNWIETRCGEMVETLNNANRRGRLTREVLVRLRELGQVFYDELLTHNIKKKLDETEAEHLSLSIDDQLVHVPWELLYDGKQFLCQRFNIGRLVKTQQTIVGVKSRSLAKPLRMLLLADPGGDLKGAYEESKQIRDFMDQHKDFVNVSQRTENITLDFVRGKIRNFDFVHFAGHADYNPESPEDSGWRLSEGSLKASDIIKMAGTAAMPAMIFSNACQSARTEEWTITESFQNEIFGLANAFLLGGVKHYLGTFWEVLDEPSSRFAMEFYKNLLGGSTAGEAVRLAREVLIKEYGPENIVWASYILYGDPTTNYLDYVIAAEPVEEPALRDVSVVGTGVRAGDGVIDFSEPAVPKKKRVWWGVAAGVIGLAIALLLGYPLLSDKQIGKYETSVLANYHEGNFDGALQACNVLEGKRPNTSLADLIRGNIYLRQGRLDEAEASYQKALHASKGTNAQKAEALIGLGRLSSIQKQPDAALEFYQQASQAAPQSRQAYLSQAVVLEHGGNYDQALGLLTQAQSMGPSDPVIAALATETRKKVALAQDKQKQERVDQLVAELLETMKSPVRAVPSDGWTSPPLSIWLMEFEPKGYSLQEGEEQLLASGIIDQLLQHSRGQVVERTLLDKLLEELKLGTSELTDRSTALALGKILAARLIISGQVVYAGAQTQVSMRLIETETGRITAAINETFGSIVPVSVLSEKLSKPLLIKLDEIYPLRGKISELDGEEVKLNIGQKVGVKMGQKFKLMDEDVTLEIVGIQPDTSLAKVAAGDGKLGKGFRVQVLSEG